MNIKYTNIIESLKKTKPVDFVYPGIFILFLGTTAVLFSLASQSISKNINKAFSVEQGDDTQSLDLARYALVAKKLNIAVDTAQKNADISPVTQAETPATAPVSAPKPLDKKAITINVLNSTTKKGVASEIASALVSAGFSAPKTGNEQKAFTVTTVFVKKSKYDYMPSLLESIVKNYPEAVATTTPESAVYDATIIIGDR